MQTVNLGKVRGDDGASVFIKYANDLSGSGMTDIYSGQKYIGVKVSKDAQTGSYQWMKFIGDNGANGASCFIKYNTINSLTGATNTWTSGQNWMGIGAGITEGAATWTWCKFIDDVRTAIDTKPIDISISSGTRYYFGSTVSGTISGTANIILTQCAGTITVSGGSAKVYIYSSPKLTVTNATDDAANRLNIFIDGIAEYRSNKSLTIPAGTSNLTYIPYDDIRPLISDYASILIYMGIGAVTVTSEYGAIKYWHSAFTSSWINYADDMQQAKINFDSGMCTTSFGLNGQANTRFATIYSNYIIRRKA